MLGNEEIRTHLLKRYKCFAELIAAKISERTSKVSGEYFAWLLLLMSDGLSIHQTIGNDHLDTEMFIQQTAKYIEDFFPEQINTEKRIGMKESRLHIFCKARNSFIPILFSLFAGY